MSLTRNALRLVVGALALIALAALAAGCGSSNKSSTTSSSSSSSSSGGGGDGGKIALLLPESKTTRYEQQDKPNFINRVKQLCPKCQVIYSNADQDAAKQLQQAESALTQGAKVLVLDAVDVQAAGTIVNKAKAQKVPVISYGRLVANAPLDYYVSIDPYKVGQQQAKVLLDALKGKPNPRIVMVNGSPTDSNAPPYKKGAHSVFTPAGVKVLKEYDTTDWSPDKAQTEMEQAITAVGAKNIDGVYVANDGMAAGVIAAMKGNKLDPKTHPVTGQDAQVDGIQRILTGDQLMTVYQPIQKIAYASAELAVPLAQGKTPPPLAKEKVNNGSTDVPAVLLPTISITKDNIQSTVIADGFLKASQVCTSAFQAACAKVGIH